jgi:hypothetical protein
LSSRELLSPSSTALTGGFSKSKTAAGKMWGRIAKYSVYLIYERTKEESHARLGLAFNPSYPDRLSANALPSAEKASEGAASSASFHNFPMPLQGFPLRARVPNLETPSTFRIIRNEQQDCSGFARLQRRGTHVCWQQRS